MTEAAKTATPKTDPKGPKTKKAKEPKTEAVPVDPFVILSTIPDHASKTGVYEQDIDGKKPVQLQVADRWEFNLLMSLLKDSGLQVTRPRGWVWRQVLVHTTKDDAKLTALLQNYEEKRTKVQQKIEKLLASV